MKKFTKSVFFFLVLTLPALYLAGYIVDRGLKKSKIQYYAVWNNIYGAEINADMIMCGPSRAYQHFSPRIFDSVLNINTYNLGMEGWFIPMQFARVKVYCQHNKKPKYILQSVDHLIFRDNENVMQYEQFLPYTDDTILSNITERYPGKLTLSEHCLPIFKYNNHLNLIKEGFLSYCNLSRGTNALYKGFAGQYRDWDGWFEKFVKMFPNGKNEIVDPYVITQFEAYIKYCKANDIKMILVFAPVLHEAIPYTTNYQYIRARIKKYSVQYDLPYLDYSDDSICYHRELFYNHLHLNAEGANLFSKKAAADLKAIIKTDEIKQF